MPVTTEDIKQFVDERWKHVECPRCGTNLWDLGQSENFKGLIPLGDDGAASIVGLKKALPVVWLVCQKCGHVEFIGIKTIRRWQEEKNATK